MKFVIKSLLFVNLILQLTSALRKCFDHDQNLMLTIILLAFSLIGLIGLVIGNRFILVIFAACMTLILIASITIYAIGKTEKDALQPKVPYYVNIPADLEGDNKRHAATDSGGRIKSLVNKLLNRGQKPDGSSKQQQQRSKNRANKTKNSSLDAASQMRRSMAIGAGNANQQRQYKQSGNLSGGQPLLAPAIVLDDYSDDPTSSSLHHQLQLPVGIGENSAPMARSTSLRAAAHDESASPASSSSSSSSSPNKLNELQPGDSIKPLSNKMDDEGDFNQVPSEQWLAYERYLYEKYLNIVSQSIDLIMQTILGSWLALLLDEDADHCFGNNNNNRPSHRSSSSSSQMRKSSSLGGGGGGGGGKEPPVYNYNGVRYSIRPEPSESPGGRVVVR